MSTQQASRHVKLAPRRTSVGFQRAQLILVALLAVFLAITVFGPLSRALNDIGLPAPADLKDKVVEMAPQLPFFHTIPLARVHEIYEGGAKFSTTDTISVIGVYNGSPALYSLTGTFMTTGERIEIDSDTILFEIRQVNERGTFYYWTSWGQLEQLE